MKVISHILFFAILPALVSCSGNTDRFKISGRFLNFNRGELYVYSPDNDFGQLDTIKVQDGRFLYEKIISKPSTFVLVFPNFTEVPIFGEPSKSVKVNADASHLKEIEIKGSKPNRMMNGFRAETASSSPLEVKKKAVAFVKENPESIVSSYLVSRYLVRTDEPDYKTALTLLRKIVVARPADKSAKKLKNQVELLNRSLVGGKLPEFSFKTTDGKAVKNSFCKGKIGVISVWASWSYESMDIQRTLRDLCKDYPDRIAQIGISLDMDKNSMEANIKANDLTQKTCWDGLVWDSPMLRKLGLGDVVDNIIINEKGIIAFRGVEKSHLKENIESLLNNKNK